ncbi:hypothetical protein LXA43DRAFT_986587 [Ganoderma leucocontextum]|nr:hypothetical protein LXA43DRAFT_986587 [Ganoderma leucocontextum]
MSHTLAPTFSLPPFDNPVADTILRCRDGVHFRVRSAILSEASPVFSDMLAAISCAGGDSDREGSENYDGKPIITVVENSDVIDPLLRLCYPTTDPVLKDLQDIRPVLAATMKYQMEEATVLLKRALLSYVETQPLRVWAHACLLRLEEEARTAARALVGKELPSVAPEELQEVSAGDFYRLTKFLLRQGSAAEAVKLFEADPTDIKEPPKKTRRWSGTENDDPLEPFTFRSRPYADIICRSSDGQDFRAHRIILCLASTTLKDKISSLSPETSSSASSASDDLPVIQVGVDAEALGAVLESCYVEPSSLAYDLLSPHYVMSMMVAARTLGMQRLLGRLQQTFLGPYMSASRDEPLLGYLLAARMQFPEIAKQLACSVHHNVFSYGYLPEMECTPAHFYHSLLVNRRKNAPVNTASSTAKSATGAPSSASGAKKLKMGSLYSADSHPWVQGLVAEHLERLYKLDRSIDSFTVSPRYEDILQDSLTKNVWCRNCEPNVRSMIDMSVSWKRVHDALSKNDYTHQVPAK